MPATIYVIDDHATFARVLCDGIELYGYNAVTFSGSAEDIQQRVCREQPDLVVLDIRLVGADGREICRALTSHPQARHIPIILITAYPNLLWGGRSYGEAALFVKPFSLFDLLETVDALIAPDKPSTP